MPASSATLWRSLWRDREFSGRATETVSYLLRVSRANGITGRRPSPRSLPIASAARQRSVFEKPFRTTAGKSFTRPAGRQKGSEAPFALSQLSLVIIFYTLDQLRSAITGARTYQGLLFPYRSRPSLSSPLFTCTLHLRRPRFYDRPNFFHRFAAAPPITREPRGHSSILATRSRRANITHRTESRNYKKNHWRKDGRVLRLFASDFYAGAARRKRRDGQAGLLRVRFCRVCE